ncbi:MAG TPA: LytTR family DNA-binding domain-containing protein [Acidimicrobiales bacterium]|nr:LytTR family DNA-binding domain-containing protein [Acidimicrobiales bacterium]
MSQPTGLTALAVDDEAPALDELAWLLRNSPLVDRVEAVSSADDALRKLDRDRFDVVLADIRMPGLDGLELARVLARFSSPPAVVFVTAHESHAVEAFGVGAAGYLLKPLDAERLGGVLGRVLEGRPRPDDRAAGDDFEALAAERSGRTTIVHRAEVEWVESAGDYVRLHTRDEHVHLVRVPMALLEERWSPHGFARVHRGFLVALDAVRELRTDGTQTVVRLGAQELPVSRRHARELRDRLVRHASRGRR